MVAAAEQYKARQAEEQAQQRLTDALAALRLPAFEHLALEAAADAYARARAARMVAEREVTA